MSRRSRLVAVAGLCAVSLSSIVSADTLALRRGATDPLYFPSGYAGSADTTLYYYSPAQGSPIYPDVWMRSSNGGFGSTRVINGPSHERALYRYDLSGLTGKGIDVTGDASLTFTVNGGTAVGSGSLMALYEMSAANAGWVEGNNTNGHFPTNATVKAKNGDPTWFYKAIDTVNNTPTTDASADLTSIKWASGQTTRGPAGSNPEGYANTGGLWNWIDLVDQDPSTVASSYLNMDANMDPVSIASTADIGATMSFTIPEAMVQRWIDSPSSNAGLLGRFVSNSYLDLWSSEAGTANLRPTLTFNFSTSPPVVGDFNGDRVVDAMDIDLLFAATQGSIPPADAKFDVNSDGNVNSAPNTASSDADYWIRQIKLSEYGDVTLNGHVDFDDLLALAQHYGNTVGGWAQGNLDGSGGIGFDDLLLLAQNYGFNTPGLSSEQFAADWSKALSLVPEPASLASVSAMALFVRRSRR